MLKMSAFFWLDVMVRPLCRIAWFGALVSGDPLSDFIRPHIFWESALVAVSDSRSRHASSLDFSISSGASRHASSHSFLLVLSFRRSLLRFRSAARTVGVMCGLVLLPGLVFPTWL